MTYPRALALAATLTLAGCFSESPVGTTDPGDSLGIPPAPKTVPFRASEQNTIVVVPPFLCIEPDYPTLCSPRNPILHAEFPGTIEGTHIGAGTIFATSQVDFDTFPWEQTTQWTITSEDGDLLTAVAAGTAVPGANPGDVAFSGNFTFTGGTGRFATASGGGTYAGTANTIAAQGQFEMEGVISR